MSIEMSGKFIEATKTYRCNAMQSNSGCTAFGLRISGLPDELYTVVDPERRCGTGWGRLA